MLSDEEAAYLSSAFPAGQESLDHMMLQCPECKSVNFPGTEQSLVVNRDGKMTSMSGSVMQEEDYRAVTRHVHNSCSNLPLTKVPVRLTSEECATAARLVTSTPEAEEGGDEAPRAGERGFQFVNAPHGLYPAPFQEATAATVLPHFRFVGRLLAKALLDQRNLDLPLSQSGSAFAKALLDQRDLNLPLSQALLRTLVGQKLCFQDLAAVDPTLFATLAKMKAVAAEATAGAPVLIDGCPVEDLCLDMTLPGYPDIELVPGGKSVAVSAENLADYVEKVASHVLVDEVASHVLVDGVASHVLVDGVARQVASHVLVDGVARQVAELTAGFNQVFPIEHLAVFTAEELELHIRGDVTAWDLETVRASIQPDHGYTESSLPVVWLVKYMASMGRLERRLFMRFITVPDPANAI
ncbi:hypothetical protein T484DRAFT_1790788 [Baffinella frigidus]|nr:hypothetical protein T484DRAFT_1790788 [Cryptophyta sp. CCMP2293]